MSISADLILANVGSSQLRHRGEPVDQFLQRLVQLSLNDRHVKDMTGIDACPNLRLLYLRNNQIPAITHLDHLHLTHLDLQYNYIERLEGLEGCPSLTHLYLSFNRIKEITSLAGPVALQELHLSSQDLGSPEDPETPPQLVLTPEALAPVAVCFPEYSRPILTCLLFIVELINFLIYCR